MSYRWKPSKAQKRAYYEKMKEAEEKYKFISSNGPIREGCYVEYVDKATCTIMKGLVLSDHYGEKTGQHTFNVAGVLVKGRNLYDRLLIHIPGEMSKNCWQIDF
jgi:hypothetical protein